MAAIGWLERFLAKVFFDHGTELPQRSQIDFEGAGVTVVDDEANDTTVVTIAGGGSPVGSDGDLQMKAGTALAASHANDDGTKFRFGKPIWLTVSAVDTPGLYGDASGNLYVGTNTTYTSQAASVGMYASAAVGIGVGGSTYFYASGGFAQSWVPLLVKDGSAPSAAGTGGILFSTGGLPYWIDNAGFNHQLAEYRICLNANFTSSASISVQSVTNMSFPAVAGDVWEVEFGGWTSQASGTAGVAFGFNGSATFTQEGVVEGSTTGVTAYTAAEMTAQNTGYGALNTVAATKGTVWGKTVITVSASGTVNLAVKPLGAVVSTLVAGFSMTAKRIKKV